MWDVTRRKVYRTHVAEVVGVTRESPAMKCVVAVAVVCWVDTQSVIQHKYLSCRLSLWFVDYLPSVGRPCDEDET